MKNTNKLNITTALVLIIIICCGILSTYAETIITNTDITADAIYAPTGRSATFIIAASDSSTLAKEQADYVCDGTDDQVQINAAIDELGDKGGKIQLTTGVFMISSPIIIEKNGVWIDGMGNFWGNGGTIISLYSNSNCDIIKIGKTGDHIFFPTLSNIFIWGNSNNQASGNGIVVENGTVSDLCFTNIGISRIEEDGIRFVADDGWLYSLINVWVEYCGGNGIYQTAGGAKSIDCTYMYNNESGIRSYSGDMNFINSAFSHNRFHGIHWTGGGKLKINNCIISNNDYLDSGNYDGIHFATDSGNSGSIIYGNTFIGDSKQRYGIRIAGGTNDNIIITNNQFSGHKYGPMSISSGVNTNGLIRNNVGFVTENIGIATLVNGQTVIIVSHGLAVTPSAGDIMITPIEAWGNMTQFYIDTYTSTNFTIHADQDPGQDVDFAWKAIVL